MCGGLFAVLMASGCGGEEEEWVSGPRWPDVVAERADLAGMTATPDVEAVRSIGSAEVDEVLRGCLEELGYTVVEPDFGPGLQIEDVPLQEARAANTTCLARYPYRRDLADLELTDRQLGIHYDWTAGQVAGCIDDLGLDTAQPPSLAEFVRGYRADEPTWFPGTYSVDELDRIRSECDLLPPREEVYPDEDPS